MSIKDNIKARKNKRINQSLIENQFHHFCKKLGVEAIYKGDKMGFELLERKHFFDYDTIQHKWVKCFKTFNV